MEHDVSVRMHFYTWGEFAFNFFQNYTVKIFEAYYSNSQDHCEQESTERTSKPIKENFLRVSAYKKV